MLIIFFSGPHNFCKFTRLKQKWRTKEIFQLILIFSVLEFLNQDR